MKMEVDTDVEVDVSQLTVSKLKRELKKRGATATGLKAELQERLRTILAKDKAPATPEKEDSPAEATAGDDGDAEVAEAAEEEAEVIEIDEGELLLGKVVQLRGNTGFIAPDGTTERAVQVAFAMDAESVKSKDTRPMLRRGMAISYNVGTYTAGPRKGKTFATNIAAVDGEPITWFEKQGDDDRFDRKDGGEEHRFSGRVVFFNGQKRFGKIETDVDIDIEEPKIKQGKGARIFVGKEDIISDDPYVELREGQFVEFSVYTDGKGVGCSRVSKPGGGKIKVVRKPDIIRYNRPETKEDIPEGVRFKGKVWDFVPNHFLWLASGEDLSKYGIKNKIYGHNSELVSDAAPCLLGIGQDIEFTLIKDKDGFGIATEISAPDGDALELPPDSDTTYKTLETILEREYLNDNKIYEAEIVEFKWDRGDGRLKIDGLTQDDLPEEWVLKAAEPAEKEGDDTKEDAEMADKKKDGDEDGEKKDGDEDGEKKEEKKKEKPKKKFSPDRIYFHRDDICSDDPAFGISVGLEVQVQLYKDKRGIAAAQILRRDKSRISGEKPDEAYIEQERARASRDAGYGKRNQIRVPEDWDETELTDRGAKRGTVSSWRGDRGQIESNGDTYYVHSSQLQMDRGEAPVLRPKKWVEFFVGKDRDKKEIALFVTGKDGRSLREDRGGRKRRRSPDRGGYNRGAPRQRRQVQYQRPVQYMMQPQTVLVDQYGRVVQQQQVQYVSAAQPGMRPQAAQWAARAQQQQRQPAYGRQQQQQQRGSFTYSRSGGNRSRL